MKYRESIGLGDKYRFGTEIEFSGIYLLKVEEYFYDHTNLPVTYLLHHKSRGTINFDKWYLDEDGTVTKGEKNTALGGELSSRILTDKKEDWQELKKICEILKKIGATINENCSNHIHIDLSTITNEVYFFEILSKLIALHEINMQFFYMGDDYLPRPTRYEYARSLGDVLIQYINSVDFKNPESLNTFKRYRNLNYFSRNDAINLQNYNANKQMEIRYPNGTLNEKTIQNNINFSLKFIDAIAREIFDPEELTNEITRYKSNEWYDEWMESIPNYKRFERLSKTIATSEEDHNDFMTQYEKVLSKKVV